VREARTAWQAVHSVGKPLPPAKSISMRLRYAHTVLEPVQETDPLKARTDCRIFSFCRQLSCRPAIRFGFRRSGRPGPDAMNPSAREKHSNDDLREARTTWQAVHSVGKPLPPAKGISMSLRYAHTACQGVDFVDSSAVARQSASALAEAGVQDRTP
jgi:hypothetical protein